MLFFVHPHAHVEIVLAAPTLTELLIIDSARSARAFTSLIWLRELMTLAADASEMLAAAASVDRLEGLSDVPADVV